VSRSKRLAGSLTRVLRKRQIINAASENLHNAACLLDIGLAANHAGALHFDFDRALQMRRTNDAAARS